MQHREIKETLSNYLVFSPSDGTRRFQTRTKVEQICFTTINLTFFYTLIINHTTPTMIHASFECKYKTNGWINYS